MEFEVTRMFSGSLEQSSVYELVVQTLPWTLKGKKLFEDPLRVSQPGIWCETDRS